MSSTVRSNKTRLALGLAALGLAGWLPVQACSLAAWDPNPTGAPVAGGPGDDPAVRRYSGACGLAPALNTASFVQESTAHSAEGSTAPFRGRFFVYTGLTAGAPTVFRATSEDAGAGSSVVEVVYDSVDGNFDFSVNGASAGSTAAASAPANRWVQVQFVYQNGQTFQASTRSGDTTTQLTTTAQGTATAIESVQLGVITPGGAAGALFFDEYEGSRAATPGTGGPFTMRCRGDTDANGSYELTDIFGVIDEFLAVGGGSPIPVIAGQPDYDEDGDVDLDDIFGVIDEFLAFGAGTPGSGCQ